MLGNVRKTALATAFVALAPVAPLLSGSGSDAQAHTSINGSVVIGGRVGVLGFSFGDPYASGHVHHAPVHCSVGPLYYYPEQHVYAHYYPRYRYHRYSRPVYYRPAYYDHDYYGDGYYRGYYRQHYGGHYGRHYDGCGHGRSHRGHAYGHYKYGHHKKVRGHYDNDHHD